MVEHVRYPGVSENQFTILTYRKCVSRSFHRNAPDLPPVLNSERVRQNLTELDFDTTWPFLKVSAPEPFTRMGVSHFSAPSKVCIWRVLKLGSAKLCWPLSAVFLANCSNNLWLFECDMARNRDSPKQ